MQADQSLLEALWLSRKELMMYLNPNLSAIWLKMSTYPANSSSPEVTSVLPGLKPRTFSASSSLPIHTSTYCIRLVITFWAFSEDHSFLRKFKSTETVTPWALAAFKAASVSSIAASLTAGVIPVKWNQSASAKISSKLNSSAVAVEIELCARS